MKLYKFFHFAQIKRMCNSLVSFFNLRQPTLSIIFIIKSLNLNVLFTKLLATLTAC